MSERCIIRRVAGDVQCTLGAGHLCECVFVGEPLTLIQGLAWGEEMRITKTTAHNEAIEQAARMVHRGTDDDALIERVRLLKRTP